VVVSPEQQRHVELIAALLTLAQWAAPRPLDPRYEDVLGSFFDLLGKLEEHLSPDEPR